MPSDAQIDCRLENLQCSLEAYHKAKRGHGRYVYRVVSRSASFILTFKSLLKRPTSAWVLVNTVNSEMVRFVHFVWTLLACRYACYWQPTASAESITAILDVEGTLVQPRQHIHQRHHHNCIHDEKLDEFASTVDTRSLVVHQRLAPHVDSYAQSFVVDNFLDTIGASKPATVPQRMLVVEASAQASFRPLRIAFDLSKLTSYADLHFASMLC